METMDLRRIPCRSGLRHMGKRYLGRSLPFSGCYILCLKQEAFIEQNSCNTHTKASTQIEFQLCLSCLPWVMPCLELYTVKNSKC